MIKIEMLRCFSTVAQSGNLADAAARLGRTQSAISMTLKQLEEHLGQSLFETERKNHLTPLGREVFQLAQQQLRQFDGTVDAIEAAANAPQGLLRIASIPSASGHALSAAIATLTSRHPAVKVDLRDMDSVMVMDALLQGQADIGIASGRPALNGITQETLFEDRFGLLCSKDHPLARQKSAPSLDEVLSSGFIRNNLCQLIKAQKMQDALPLAKITVHNTHSLVAMVRTGNWTTVLPESVAGILRDGLAFRPISDLDQQRPVSLLVKSKSQFPQLVEELVDILRKSSWV